MRASGTCTEAQHISTEKMENNTKQESATLTLWFLLFLWNRWPPSCFSPTSPPSSMHTSCSGRRWFFQCCRKSDSQANPLTPLGWRLVACRYNSLFAKNKHAQECSWPSVIESCTVVFWMNWMKYIHPVQYCVEISYLSISMYYYLWLS